MIVRPAEIEDFARIAEIYGYHVRHGLSSFEEDPPSEDEMRERWRKIDALHLPYLVALMDGELAGYAYAAPYRPRRAYRFTVEDSVYVDIDFHRQGIGSTLLARLIETTTVLGYRQMIAIIGDSANKPSIALHEAFGFRHVGVLQSVGYKFERWVDTVILQRFLS
ncbi:MAG TPA: GNAT family N-acetyltransferase [Bryobacteraceae bacterium]|nr:GNAT family N-acetyltransferase [Bryobacteraceae bacterium]